MNKKLFLSASILLSLLTVKDFCRLEQFASALEAVAKGVEAKLKKPESDDELIAWAKALNLTEFYNQLEALPVYPGAGKYPKTKFLTKEIFIKTMKAFLALRESELKKAKWLEHIDPDFKPSEFFVHKLIWPADAEIKIHADWHGDAKSLKKWLEKTWGKKRIFLGDYTDRGPYSIECLFLVMQEYLRDSENAVLLRGNHEDAKINADPWNGGFILKGTKKLGITDLSEANEFTGMLKEVYKKMPSALYLGCKNADGSVDYVIFVHGLFHMGYDSRSLLEAPDEKLFEKIDQRSIDSLNFKKKQLLSLFSNNFHEEIETKFDEMIDDLGDPKHKGIKYEFGSGFAWNDFRIGKYLVIPNFGRGARGSGFILYPRSISEWIEAVSKPKEFSLNAVVRGHQHFLRLYDCKNKTKIVDHKNDKHISALKVGSNTRNFPRYSILSLPVAPRTGHYEKYPEFKFLKDYDTAATITLSDKGFENWALSLDRIPVAG